MATYFPQYTSGTYSNEVVWVQDNNMVYKWTPSTTTMTVSAAPSPPKKEGPLDWLNKQVEETCKLARLEAA